MLGRLHGKKEATVQTEQILFYDWFPIMLNGDQRLTKIPTLAITNTCCIHVCSIALGLNLYMGDCAAGQDGDFLLFPSFPVVY